MPHVKVLRSTILDAPVDDVWADKGYVMVIPEDGCSTMNADWHNASVNYALQNVSAVTKTHEVISALG